MFEILKNFKYPITYRFLSIIPHFFRRKVLAAMDAKIKEWSPHKKPANLLDQYIPWTPGAA